MLKDAWFSPKAITFNREQILWLISVLPILRGGEYPPEPIDSSGYTDAPLGKKGKLRKAYFETPTGLAAEVDIRIEKAGIDGGLLEAVYGAEFQDKASIMRHWANILRAEAKTIDQCCRRALAYITGWQRKPCNYSEFRTCPFANGGTSASKNCPRVDKCDWGKKLVEGSKIGGGKVI